MAGDRDRVHVSLADGAQERGVAGLAHRHLALVLDRVVGRRRGQALGQRGVDPPVDDPVRLQVHAPDLDPRPGAVGVEVEPLDADRLVEGLRWARNRELRRSSAQNTKHLGSPLRMALTDEQRAMLQLLLEGRAGLRRHRLTAGGFLRPGAVARPRRAARDGRRRSRCRGPAQRLFARPGRPDRARRRGPPPAERRRGERARQPPDHPAAPDRAAGRASRDPGAEGRPAGGRGRGPGPRPPAAPGAPAKRESFAGRITGGRAGALLGWEPDVGDRGRRGGAGPDRRPRDRGRVRRRRR